MKQTICANVQSNKKKNKQLIEIHDLERWFVEKIFNLYTPTCPLFFEK